MTCNDLPLHLVTNKEIARFCNFLENPLAMMQDRANVDPKGKALDP